MSLVLGIAGFTVLMMVAIVVIIVNAMKDVDDNHAASAEILNIFEPDNTAPKITELIDYHKENDKAKYNIESGQK